MVGLALVAEANSFVDSIVDLASSPVVLGLFGMLLTFTTARSVSMPRAVRPRDGEFRRRIDEAVGEIAIPSDPRQARVERVARLRKLLDETTELLGQIEGDITDAQSRVDELEEQLERDAPLAAVSNEQAEAFRREVINAVEQVGAVHAKRDLRKDLAIEFGVGALWFVAGVLVTLWIT